MNSSGSFLFWIKVTHFVPQVGFGSALFFGSILSILNIFVTSKVFGSYKYLINAFTIMGIVFATVEIIVFPNVHNFNDAFLFFSFTESFGLNGIETKNIPLAGYTFFHSATMALLSVQFIYRYWAVFDQDKLRLFKGPKSLIWVIFCAFFGFQYSLGTYFFFELDEISIDYFKEEMISRYNSTMTQFPATAMLAYDPRDGSVRWWNVMGVMNICSIVNTQYGIMFYCGWSMHTKMEERISNLSENLKRHHKQLFKTLIVQLSAPTVILFLPLSFMILLPLFRLKVSFPSGIFLTSFTLYPAMDAIILMYVVSEYRKTAQKILTKLGLWKDNHTSRISATYQTSQM